MDADLSHDATDDLAQIEADEKSASLFGRVANEWTEKDFKATATWIGTIPAGKCRDQAVWAYASKVSRLDPAAAADWAATGSTEEMRAGMIGSILDQWKKRDPNAAGRWLEGTTALSAELKAALKDFHQ